MEGLSLGLLSWRRRIAVLPVSDRRAAAPSWQFKGTDNAAWREPLQGLLLSLSEIFHFLLHPILEVFSLLLRRKSTKSFQLLLYSLPLGS